MAIKIMYPTRNYYFEFIKGICENCSKIHPASLVYSDNLNRLYISENFNEPESDGIPHDSDCLWID